MGLILDSTAVIAGERGGKNARQLLESVALETGDEGIAISVITVQELAHGVIRADTPERRWRRERFLDELLTGVPYPAGDSCDRSPRRTNRRAKPS